MKHGLGRLVAYDERDKSHPMTVADVPLPAFKYWATGKVLDQGETSTCVGHSWAAWLMASPTRTKTGPNPFQIYRECTQVDEWATNDNEEHLEDSELQFGTSVRAGAKVLDTRGHISEYVWGFDMQTVRSYVLTRGPVVLGVDWYSGFFKADSKGFIHPTGEIEGGHAFLCSGFSQRLKAFRCLNSWGAEWGYKGRFWIHEEVMELLMNQGAEAASAIEKEA